jgi:molybdopterin synthase catalytic subunit
MRREIIITATPLDEAPLNAARQISPGSGAVVIFLGYVRELEGADKIAGIDYESFDAMAQRQFTHILNEIESRWPIESIRLVHRTGFVAANAPSLWVEVISGHRGEAFAACQYLIDEMKKRVPIWKRACPSDA